MPTQEQEWNAPMLLLHTIGARSGREHIVPMRTRVEGDAMYVFGSAHGYARQPDWYRNVQANPDFQVEKGTETFPVHAAEVAGAERERIFRAHATTFPVFAEYEQKLERTIPVLKLERQR